MSLSLSLSPSLKKGVESLFISFDNLFLTEEHPELIKQMDLDTVFPGKKFILNTLFISNFPQKIMGKSFSFVYFDIACIMSRFFY